jgi:hypothetical protein
VRFQKSLREVSAKEFLGKAHPPSGFFRNSQLQTVFNWQLGAGNWELFLP